MNRVERSPEAICVFYHATFQEYFAALGVESWDCFLPRDHESSPVEGKYRIFEPQWKQVILLWLGREDIADEKKEEFINKLVSFDTGCDDGNFYCYRAYFLAAEGITQYADFTPFDEVTNPQNYLLVDIVISQLIEWAVGYIDANDQKYNYLYPLKEGAITALRITKKTKVIEYLMHGLEMMLSSDECSDEMINYSPGKEELIREYAILLSEFTPDEKIVIEVLLFRNLGTAEGEFTSRQTMDDWDRPPSLTAQELIKLASTLVSISESPDKISQEKIQLEDYFVSCLEITEDESERRAAAEYLGETAQGNTQVIRELERILKNPRNTDVYRWAAYSLGKTDPGNLNAIAAIVYILENPKDKNISKWAIEVLSEIAQGNDQAITALVLMSDTTKDEDIRKSAAWSLGEIVKGNPQAIAALIRILKTTENECTRRQGADSLQKILATPEQYKNAVSVLKDYLSDEVHQNNFDRFDQCYKVLWECAANLPYPDFYHAWHSAPE